MRISKLLSAVCAAVVCAGVMAVRAQNSPNQTAALAALKQKMNELDAQASQSANPTLAPIVVTPSGATVQQPSPPATPPPAARQPAPVPVPVATPAPAPAPAPGNSGLFTPVPPPSHPDGQTHTQPALQVKTNKPNVQTTSPNIKSPASVAGTQKEAKAAARAEAKAQQEAAAKAKADAQKAAAAEQKQKRPTPAAEVRQKAAPTIAEAKPNKEAKVKSSKKPTAKEAQPAKPEVTTYPGKALGFDPVAAPPPPVSAEQEAALQALLSRYMANEITPDQYQTERKKIMAGR